MDHSTLQTELDSNIFTITINRPDKLNALNHQVLEELQQVMESVYTDEQIKAVIITGAGEKAFIAGADIAEFTELKDDQGSW